MNFARYSRSALAAVFLSLVAGHAAPDTLEIHLLKVEFQYENPDNSLTTGRGYFDSDPDTASANYSLDPQGTRASADYWNKHLQFAADYYRRASGGKLTIVYDVFPHNQRSYVVGKHIIDYNRTAKRDGEKTAEYNEARVRDYMGFVSDALRAALADNDSPFANAPTTGSRKRVYMVAHAGASRLVDGGSLGTNGADTPGDFLDFFVDSGDWKTLTADSDRKADSLGVVVGADTIKQVMVVSETASQDGLNWGINGIMVNQIGSQIGMPITYDLVKGISRLGYFDVMDFAGYNAGNGFFPILPSAWLRAYMGWATVREVRPGSAMQSYDLPAAGLGQSPELLKVPLTANEYLLIENRQRSLLADGKVEITLDGKTISLPADSLATLFLDSICTSGSCKVNSKKAKGVVLANNSPDAALPGSGLAVWHVNDWYLKERLPLGVVNYWEGDTLRDHQFGIALVESDGVLSIGKKFTNALGQAAYDYGSGADLIPHQRYTASANGKLVTSIEASGYGNTATTWGSYSGLRIVTEVPATATLEKNANGFSGDSVRNWRSLSLPVRVVWGDVSMPNGLWPRALEGKALPRSAVFAQVAGKTEPVLVQVSATGQMQWFGPRGDTACVADTAIADNALLSGNSQRLCRAGAPLGSLVGVAAQGAHVVSVHATGVFATHLFPDDALSSWTRESVVTPQAPSVAPLIADSLVWWGDASYLRSASFAGMLALRDSLAWPLGFVPQELAVCGDLDNDGHNDLVIAGAQGRVAVLRSAQNTLGLLKSAQGGDAVSRIVCSDFNRDGAPDAFVIGSAGFGQLLDVRNDRLLAPARRYKRGMGSGASMAEVSAPIATDLDNDGYPEVVFLGYNSVLAIDSSGVPLSGFPVRLSRGEALEAFGSDPLAIDIDGDGKQEILVPGNGGAVYAVNSQGKLQSGVWPLAAGTFAYTSVPDYLSVYALEADSVAGPELYALHRQGAQGFSLASAKILAGSWALPGNGNARSNYLDPAALTAPVQSVAQSSIDEFFIFPNPVRHGKASARFRLGNAATLASVEFFDINGLPVWRKSIASPGMGANQVDLDLTQLGSDVYSVRLTVQFVDGKRVNKFDRVGVVR